MIRLTSFIALVAACGLAVACQPAKTPEQVAAEQAAAIAKQMTAALGGLTGAAGATPADQAQAAQAMGAIMGAAIAQAGADPNMSAEDRAKLQAMTSGQVNPAASAWLAGANKAFAVISKVKDMAGVNAAKTQLMPIYAEMAGPSATLKAMTDDQRQIAFGSSYMQVMQMGMSAMGTMSALSAQPDVQKGINDLMEAMPPPE